MVSTKKAARMKGCGKQSAHKCLCFQMLVSIHGVKYEKCSKKLSDMQIRQLLYSISQTLVTLVIRESLPYFKILKTQILQEMTTQMAPLASI